MERNLCTESGCKAYCCFGPEIRIEEDITTEKILEWFPEAKETWWNLWEMIKNKKGVYFERRGNWATIQIVGYCPNLDENFNCTLQAAKPELCKEFEIGQDYCNTVRLNHFLPPFREWNYQQFLANQHSSENLPKIHP